MDIVKIGKVLQELRKEKGLTQEQLAEQMGLRAERFLDGKPAATCRTWTS